MKLCHPSRRGFTLIEIMIAVVIFTMVMAAIYSVWATVIRSTILAKDVAAQSQRERVTLRTIEDAIEAVQSFQASPRYYSFNVENGDSSTLSFTARVPDMFPRNGKFINPNTGRSFEQRRLTFSLEPDQDGGKSLMLRQNPVLMDPDEDEQKYPLVLAKNVRDFTVECWGTNQQTGKVGWWDEWEDTNSIPRMLRVSLVIGSNVGGGASAPDVAFARVYSVPSQMMPTILQRGGGAGAPGAPGAGGPVLQPPPIRK